eukprot:gene32354-biopygen2120
MSAIPGGAVGGDAELGVARLLRAGRLTKPVVARVLGVCAEQFGFDVQFGHTGSRSNAALSSVG